ncbi:MAG: prenyltransferase/squalene oxidase repeat-containing protein [Candidatus Thorarchaeota archaeon]
MKKERQRVLLVLGLTMVFVVALAPMNTAAATPSEIEQSITEGLEWLASQQDEQWGHWPGWDAAARTGFAVLKLVDRAYELGFDSPFDEGYEYSSNIMKGLSSIFWGATFYGDSQDTIHFSKWGGHWIYQTGICMMAIAATKTPDRLVANSYSIVYGWTYKEVLQAALNYMIIAQTEMGGWGYAAPDDDPGNWGWNDNSNSGYAVLGLLYAQKEFGLALPESLLDGLDRWIDYVQNKGNGGSGYTNPGYTNILKTGSLLFQLALVGDNAESPRVRAAIHYIQEHWNDANVDPGWKGELGGTPHYQAMYTTMKGFEAMGIETITVDGQEVDWYEEFSTAIVQTQQDDGSWPPDYWGYDIMLATEWALLALEREMAVPVAIPINVDIKPGSWPNPINPKTQGVFSVAICGSEDFDVTTIDPATVTISVPTAWVGLEPLRWSYEDVATPWLGEDGGGHELESDGILDIVFHFDTQEVCYATYLGVYGGETVRLQVQGRLYNWAGGNLVRGHDFVRVEALEEKMVVAIDLSKDLVGFYPVPGLEATLLGWGVDVHIIQGSFSIPEDANVLLIPGPRYSYSTDELEEIDEWFYEENQPRLLWVAGDSDFVDWNFFTPDVCNDILNTIGANLRISADTVEDYFYNDDAFYRVAVQTPVSDGDLNSIFTMGVSSAIFHGPTSVLGYQDGVVVDLMADSIDGVELIMRASEDAVYNNWDGTQGEFDYYSFNDITGSYPMMAIQTMLNQKYVITSGEAIFTDSFSLNFNLYMYAWVTRQAAVYNNPNAWNNGLHDGKTLVDNILYWFWHNS